MKYSEYLASRRPVDKEKARLEQHINDLLTLWRDMAIACAGAANCNDKSSPGKWATKTVEDYQEFCNKVGWP